MSKTKTKHFPKAMPIPALPFPLSSPALLSCDTSRHPTARLFGWKTSFGSPSTGGQKRRAETGANGSPPIRSESL